MVHHRAAQWGSYVVYTRQERYQTLNQAFIFFVNPNKNSKFQPLRMQFGPKEAQNLTIAAVILNSTQQPGCVFVALFHARDFFPNSF